MTAFYDSPSFGKRFKRSGQIKGSFLGRVKAFKETFIVFIMSQSHQNFLSTFTFRVYLHFVPLCPNLTLAIWAGDHSFRVFVHNCTLLPNSSICMHGEITLFMVFFPLHPPSLCYICELRRRLHLHSIFLLFTLMSKSNVCDLHRRPLWEYFFTLYPSALV